MRMRPIPQFARGKSYAPLGRRPAAYPRPGRAANRIAPAPPMTPISPPSYPAWALSRGSPVMSAVPR